MNDELDTIRIAALGFLVGMLFTLFMVCMVQYVSDEKESFPVRTVLGALYE